jgi:hypothetical protein
VSDQRHYPNYFRVAFYGDFPAALKKQPFIVRHFPCRIEFTLIACFQYRAYEWEKYQDFCERLLQKHTTAEILQTADEPSDLLKFGSQPYIHCTPVTPEPERTSHIFTNINVHPSIRGYYEHK